MKIPHLIALAAVVELAALPAIAQQPAQQLGELWSAPLDSIEPFLPADLCPGMRLGREVAVSDNRAAVSAPGAAPYEAVYLFEHHGAQWVQVARLESGEAGPVGFGGSLSLSGDRLVVGSRDKVHVFTRMRGSWIETAEIASPTGPGEGFGSEVAIDGNRIVVGATNAVDVWGIHAGAAFVFENRGNGWQGVARLDYPFGGYGGDAFGHSIALHGDALVVGAPYGKVDGHDRGAAFIFERGSGQWGFVWDVDSTADNEQAQETGWSVAMQGDLVVVGAPSDGPGLGYYVPGAAYVYRRGASGWSLEAKLAPRDELLDAVRFGSSVAVRGETVLVGALLGGTGGAASGSVYVYRKSPVGWTQVDEWAGGAAGDDYGASVALGEGFAIVGAVGSDAAGAESGAAQRRTLSAKLPRFAVSPDHVQFWNWGSEQRMALDAGVKHAGKEFVVLGSLSGTAPGTVLDGQLVPLVMDGYLVDTWNDPTSTWLEDSQGVLDAQGRALARFVVPQGSSGDPSVVGTVFHHAFVVIDPLTQRVVFASNAAPVTLSY